MRAVVFALLGACADPGLGTPTESTCPPASTSTYANFGQPFMAAYCTECHDGRLPPDERHGAPSLHDFDTRYGILGVADHVDRTAAAGPAAINRLMPPGAPRPSDDERRQLGEWLACGAP